MQTDGSRDRSGGNPPARAGGTADGRPRLTRRQAMQRMSAVATAGAAAWVVPEILTAKPAAGASMSAPGTLGGSSGGGGNGSGGGTGPTGTGPTTSASTAPAPTTSASTAPAPTSSGSVTPTGGSSAVPASSGVLAMTGGNLLRDAEVGAALVAAGWTLQRWASRSPDRTLAPSDNRDASGSQGNSA